MRSKGIVWKHKLEGGSNVNNEKRNDIMISGKIIWDRHQCIVGDDGHQKIHEFKSCGKELGFKIMCF